MTGFPRKTRGFRVSGQMERLMAVEFQVNTASVCWNILLKLRQPYRGVAVGRRAPVSARRQRSTRRYLRAIRHRAALELAEREEPAQEHFHPVADRRKVVSVALLRPEMRRPVAARRVLPGVQRHEGDLRRKEPVTQDIKQGEIL